MAFARKIARQAARRSRWLLKGQFGVTRLWLRKVDRPQFNLFALEVAELRRSEIEAARKRAGG